MAQPEPRNTETNEVARKKKEHFVQIVTWSLFAALIGGAIGYVASILQTRSDDERPPIIVRNGSVHIEEALHMWIGKKNRGKLLKSPTAPSGKAVWYHEHGNSKANRLNVLVGGIAAGSCSTTADFYAADVTNATFYYRVSETERTGVATLGANYLELEIDADADATQPSGQTFALDLYKNDASTTLKSVTLYWAKHGSDGPHTESCIFGAQPQIALFQSK